MQGEQVQSLVWKDPTCCRATKSMSHNYSSLCAWSLCFTTKEATAMGKKVFTLH